MTSALCFNSITMSPVIHQNNLWIRAAELARAIGYASEKSIANIYKRHESEFSSDMSVVINLSTTDIPIMTRIFSLRGCHLIAMFSRTPVAKQFRRWVLDVLDKIAAEEQARLAVDVNHLSLSPAQQAHIHAIVSAKVGMLPAEVQRKAYAEIWSRFGRHFQVAKYQQLPPERIGEAVEYLVGVELKTAQKTLPSARPAPHVDRLQLTPWDKVQMGKHVRQILDSGDVGPRTMECILLKLRYMDALHDMLKLTNQLAADLDRVRKCVFGKIVQAGNVAGGCFTDPIMDILCDDTYHLRKLGDELHTTAFRGLNASICGAKMLGV